MNSYRVYVLRNPKGKFYIGISEDVELRVKQHNSGQSSWTKIKAHGCLYGKVEIFHLAERAS